MYLPTVLWWWLGRGVRLATGELCFSEPWLLEGGCNTLVWLWQGVASLQLSPDASKIYSM